MTMTLVEYEAYLRTLAERIEHIQPAQQNVTKPAKKKRLVKKQFNNNKKQQ